MCWIPPNYRMAMPTKGMPSKPTQWVRPCHLMIPHLTLQVQSVGLRLHKYLSQPLVAWTLFLLIKPIGWSLAITLKWLQNHSCNIWTRQPILPLLVSRQKDKDLIILESRAGMKEIPWGKVLTKGRTTKLTTPKDEGNNTAPKKATRKA